MTEKQNLVANLRAMTIRATEKESIEDLRAKLPKQEYAEFARGQRVTFIAGVIVGREAPQGAVLRKHSEGRYVVRWDGSSVEMDYSAGLLR